jgi:AraC family transcriptional regulator of adaptative response/methylated-DNA-[protein]-cysteine methyltransferase
MSTRLAVETDPRWAQILARDPAADGKFWYSVSTTGVYCRPSCPSRAANPKNVALHDTLPAAKATGLRPCKRCKPDASSLAAEHASMIAKICRLIERSAAPPLLAQLATAAGLSSSHFHRLFKSVTGLTPKDYATAVQASRIRDNLPKANSVTNAIYDSGFNSSGRFYEKSTATLGMTPRQYRAGASGERIRFAIGQSSLGAILVGCSEQGVAAILLGDDPEKLLQNLRQRFPKAQLIGDDTDYGALIAQIVGFVEAPAIGLDLPLDIRGTAFQRRVWQALQQIPIGKTASYTDIARKIGAPESVRAVAGACAANNLALAIPCHRVIRTTGALSGYAWGLDRKHALLEREAKQS